MYVEYEKLLPDVVQMLLNEGVNEASFNKNRALYQIQQAYREFVRESKVLRRVIKVPTQSNVHEYHMSKHDGHVITKIYSVNVEYECDQWCCHEKAVICSCGCCDYTYGYRDGFISICPAPDCDGLSMEVCVALMPDTSSCLMDERVYELYKDYIAKGAVSKLLSSRDALRYEEDFVIGITQASKDSSKQWAARKPRSRRSKWQSR